MGDIILGGAQIGLNYGVVNQNGKISKDEAITLLKYAWGLGINTIDIAFAYGIPSSLINEINPGMKVHTKVAILDNQTLDSNLDDAIKIKGIEAIYIHDADELDFSNKSTIELCRRVKNFIDENDIQFGISIYDLKTLKNFINLDLKPHLVQYPLNVLCAVDDIGSLCDTLNIKSIIRSIFLQGVLIQSNFDKLPKFLQDSISVINWSKWLKKNNCDSLSVCMNGENVYHKHKVIGFANLSQLSEFYARIDSGQNVISIPDHIKTTDRKILDPRLWPKST